MNTQSNAVPESISTLQASVPAITTQPLYWSVRRELWENRSLFIAPLAVAVLALGGFLLSLIWPPKHAAMGLAGVDLEYRPLMLSMPYSHAAWLLLITGVLVGFFYCLDALYGERRDRSILFWKSLPVSDLTIVLSKAAIPLVVLPLILFAIVVATHVCMFLMSSIAVMLQGGSVVTLWRQLPLFQMQLVLFYSLAVDALWYAPFYAWLLLVSGFARRTPFLWAVLPPLALCLVEAISFHSWHIGTLLKDRVVGAASAFHWVTPDGTPVDPHMILPAQIALGSFLASPGLWIGLLLAAAFLVAAVRLRRYREPI